MMRGVRGVRGLTPRRLHEGNPMRPHAVEVLGAVVVGLVWTPVPAAAQTDADTEAARVAFEQGVADFDAGRLPEALAEFEQSYQLRPLPFVLYNVATCMETMGDKAGALDAFQRYLDLYSDTGAPDEVQDVRSHVAALEQELAPHLSATLPTAPPAQPAPTQPQVPPVVATGPVPVVQHVAVAPPAPAPHPVISPAVAPVASPPASGVRPTPEPASLVVPSGEEPAPPPEEGGGVNSGWFWTCLVATVGAGVAGAVTGGMTLSKKQDFDNTRQSYLDGHQTLDEATATGRTLANEYDGYRLATNILLPTAGALAITTILLGIFTDWSGGQEAEGTGPVLVAPSVGLGGGGSAGFAIGVALPF